MNRDDELTALAARRTRMRWEAIRGVQKALKEKGADDATVGLYLDKLAEAERGEM